MPAAVYAGTLCALSPLLVRHSQRVEPDALVMAFSALALLWCLRVVQGGRVVDYAIAGLWIGPGTASKYTPVLMAMSLYIVHLERRRVEGLSSRFLGLDDRRMGWAALLSFSAASPYTLANPGVLRRDFAYQALHMSAGYFGHARQGLGYAHYFFDVLPHALGWPALIAGLIGLALAFWGSARQRVALWGLLPYLVVLGSLGTHFDRYMLPAVLPLALGGANLLDWIRGRSAVLDRLGPLSLDHYQPCENKIYLPQFVGFVQTLAVHAEMREYPDRAAFWYLILSRTAKDPAMRGLGFERAGINYLELGQFEEARRMFRELAGFPGLELVALGNLGLVAERTGDPETARSFYELVSSRDPGGEARAWARQRLVVLDGGKRRGTPD